MFRLSNRLARELLAAVAGGLPLLTSPPTFAAVGGRWDDQSWTNRLTRGFDRRFCVLSD